MLGNIRLPPLSLRYKGALGKNKLPVWSQTVDDRSWVSICGSSPGQKKEEQLSSFLEKM